MVVTENMLLCCHVFQEEAKNIVKTPHYSRTADPIGFLLALKSQRNTEGSRLQSLVRKGWGIGDGNIDVNDASSKPRFRIKNYLAACTDVVPQRLGACETEEEFSEDKEEFVYVPDVVNSVQMTMTKKDLSELCSETSDGFQTRKLMRLAMQLLEKENRDLLALAIPQMGEYANACGEGVNSLTDPLTLNLMSCDYTALSPTVEPLLMQAYSTIGFDQAPISVGGNLAGYADKLNQRILGTNADGMDSRLRNAIWYDKNIDASFGDDKSHMITWAPTMMQSAEWFRWYGVQTDEIDTMIRRTITLPLYGRDWMFDYQLYYEACESRFILTLTRQTGLFCIPNNSNCLTGDGKLHFLLGCGSFSCEDLTALLTCSEEPAPAE